MRDPMTLKPDFRLPPEARVALLSDVHLGDGSASDLFGNKDDLFLAVLDREGGAADAVIVNGDAVDHLQGRSSARIERAHPRVFQALRQLSKRKTVLYVLGNHEDEKELRDTFPDFHYVQGVAVGERLCVAHGHQFDLNWGHGGEDPWMVHLHTFLETFFGMPIRQPLRDHVNPLNRVIHRLFFFYTQALRFEGLFWQALGRPEKYAHWQKVDNFWARGQWGDLGCIFECAMAYLESGAPWHTLVLGHSHQPGVVPLGERTYVNLGSWALDQATFGRIARSEVQVLDAMSGREYREDLYRKLIVGESLPDMAGWFRRYYRGFFRYDEAAIWRDFPHV